MNKTQNILFKYSWLLLLLPFTLVIFTVFAQSNTLVNGNVSAKYFWFYCSMGIMGISIPFIRPIKKYNLADLFLLLAVVAIIAVSLLNDAPINKTKIVNLLLLAILYFQLRKIFEKYHHSVEILIFFLIITSFVECIIGLKQLYGLENSNHALFKLTGTFFNPGPFAGFVSVIFPLALNQTIKFYKNEQRLRHLLRKLFKENSFTKAKRIFRISLSYLYGLISFGTVIVSILVIPASMSRASWLSIIIGSLIVILYNFPLKAHFKKYFIFNRQKRLFIFFILVFLSLAVSGIYFLKKDSADGRLLLWKFGIQTILENPSGAGLGNYGGAVGDAQATYFSNGKAKQSDISIADVPIYAYNEYIQIGVESGLITLVFFVCLVCLSVKMAVKQRKFSIIASLSSLLVFAFFSYPFSVLPYLVVFIILLAASNTNTNKRNIIITNCENKSKSQIYLQSISTIASISIILLCLVDRSPIYKANQEWSNCKYLINVKLYEDVTADLKKIYPYLNDNLDFLFDYSYSLHKTGDFKDSNRILLRAMQLSSDPMLYNIYGKNCQAMKDCKLAEKYFLKSYNLIPNRIYPLYLLANMHIENNNKEVAIKFARIVINHKIKVQSMAINEIKDSMKIFVRNNENLVSIDKGEILFK